MDKKVCPICSDPMAAGYIFRSGIYADLTYTSAQEFRDGNGAPVWHCWNCHILLAREYGNPEFAEQFEKMEQLLDTK